MTKLNSKTLIELAGTPSSGKSACIEGLVVDKKGTPVVIIDESINRCPFTDVDFELGVLWTTFDTFAESHKAVMSLLTSDVQDAVIFDRGLLDRLAFLRLLAMEYPKYAEAAAKLESWILKSNLLEQFDRIFIFITSFEKCIARKRKYKLKSDSKFLIVNERTIGRLNSIYTELAGSFGGRYSIEVIDDRVSEIALATKIAQFSNTVGSLVAKKG